MAQARIEDVIVARPLSHARETVQDRFVKQRPRGRWRSQKDRVKFRVFFLLDGRKDHRRISEILHVPEPAVREAMIQLALDHLIAMEVRERENPLNILLLNDSFKAIKPRGMEFAEHFYSLFFHKGKEMLASWTDELQQTWGQAYALVSGIMIGKPGQAA